MQPVNPVQVTRSYRINPGERLFEPINHILIIVSSLAHAASLMVGGRTHTTPQPVFRTATRWADCGFAIPLRGALELALHDRKPTHIEIGLITDAEVITKPMALPIVHQTKGLESVFAQIMAPMFLMYFERYNDWLTLTYGDAANWPTVLNFARIVRTLLHTEELIYEIRTRHLSHGEI